MKKRIRLALCLCLICLALVSAASAEARLEIVQARQEGDQLVLYTLLTDAETGAVTPVSPSPQQVLAIGGQYGDSQTVSVQSFSETGEGVAYAVVLDLNSYALNAFRLSAMQDALRTLVNTLRDADRTLLLVVGKGGVKALTGGFEKNRLTLSNLIQALPAMTGPGKHPFTKLWNGPSGPFLPRSPTFPPARRCLC